MGNSISVYICAGEGGRLCYCASVGFMADAGYHLVWGNEAMAAFETLHFYYWCESSNKLERRTRGRGYKVTLEIWFIFRPHLPPPVRFCSIYSLNPMNYICPTRFFCCSKLISWTFTGHAEICVQKRLIWFQFYWKLQYGSWAFWPFIIHMTPKLFFSPIPISVSPCKHLFSTWTFVDTKRKDQDIYSKFNMRQKILI